MTSRPEPTQPPETSGLTKAQVFAKAQEFARQTEFFPGDRLEALVSRIGGRITYLTDTETVEAADGSLLVWGPKDFEIKLSAFTGPERDRFTIAHELGHYVLHSGSGKQQLRAARFGSSPVDWEANWFAAALLMPESDFLETCKRYDNNTLIAARYGVSPKAVEVRKHSLGL